jgi:hypothetical protein
MQIRGTVAAVVTAFTIGGAGVGAEQPGTASGAMAIRPLRFTLDSGASVSTSQGLIRVPEMGAPLHLGAARQPLPSTPAPTGSDWNCGMPVVRPPAHVDPAIERKPDNRLRAPMRRATPQACGR